MQAAASVGHAGQSMPPSWLNTPLVPIASPDVRYAARSSVITYVIRPPKLNERCWLPMRARVSAVRFVTGLPATVCTLV